MSQAEFKKRLQILMNKPENQVCSDCPERQPRWASLIVPPPGSPPGALPIGAFCCLECSGSHRRLGVHISFVRSINLDSWKEKEVLAMENGGNKKVNAIFEAYPSPNKPSTLADGRTRERYIRDKYERRKFFNPAVLQSFYNGEQDESSEEESSEEEKVTKRSVKPSKTTVRAPSDAARRRAESRRAKISSSAQSNSTTSPKAQRTLKKPIANASTPVAPTPPVKAEVHDLLDFSADFNSPMSNPGPPPDPPSLRSSPNLDLFKGMSISNNDTIPNSDTVSDNAAQSASSSTGIEEPKKFNNDEILSLFNQSKPQAAAQMGFGNSMGGNMMPMGNGNMNMMQMNNNMMAMNNNMMPMANGMGMMAPQPANMNMNMSAFVQQQQVQNQRNMMMMMQNNGMMNQQNQFLNGMNQKAPNQGGMGNMQQPVPMMNGMQMNNAAMMMQGASTDPFSSENQPGKQQQATMGVMGGTSQGENTGMRGYGM